MARAYIITKCGANQADDAYYTGKPGINEVEPVFTGDLIKAKLYKSRDEARYIRDAMAVLGRVVCVQSVTVEVFSPWL